ncbi:universal stress protein [Microbacterium tumbae]
MSGRIVVGVVDTSAGERALNWAADRARGRRTPVLLVSVVGGAVGAVGEGSVVGEAVAAAQELLEEKAVALRGSGLTVDVEVLRGDPVRQIVAATEGESLLVIGSDYRGHGAGPSRGVHGIRIVAGAACPVVVVPDLDISARSGVVVGVDGSPVSEAAIAFAASEADRLGEPLIAVAAWTPLAVPGNPVVYPEEYLRSMQALTEEALALSLAGLRQTYPDLEIQRLIRRGYPSRAINEAAASARLTVVGSHGRGAVARFLLGSISHEVLSSLVAPTAVVR